MLQPLKEKIFNIKHMLYLSGTNMFGYWTGMIIVDFLKFIFFVLCIFILLFFFIYSEFLILFVYIIPFSIAFIILCYIFSFLVNKEENAQKIFILFALLLSILLPIFTLIRNIDFIKQSTDEKLFHYYFDRIIYFSESDLFPPSSLIIATLRFLFFFFIQFIKRIMKIKKLIRLLPQE